MPYEAQPRQRDGRRSPKTRLRSRRLSGGQGEPVKGQHPSFWNLWHAKHTARSKGQLEELRLAAGGRAVAATGAAALLSVCVAFSAAVECRRAFPSRGQGGVGWLVGDPQTHVPICGGEGMPSFFGVGAPLLGPAAASSRGVQLIRLWRSTRSEEVGLSEVGFLASRLGGVGGLSCFSAATAQERPLTGTGKCHCPFFVAWFCQSAYLPALPACQRVRAGRVRSFFFCLPPCFPSDSRLPNPHHRHRPLTMGLSTWAGRQAAAALAPIRLDCSLSRGPAPVHLFLGLDLSLVTWRRVWDRRTRPTPSTAPSSARPGLMLAVAAPRARRSIFHATFCCSLLDRGATVDRLDWTVCDREVVVLSWWWWWCAVSCSRPWYDSRCPAVPLSKLHPVSPPPPPPPTTMVEGCGGCM